MLHTRITTHSNAFPKTDPLAADFERLRRLGISRHSLHRVKLEAERLERVLELVGRWDMTITHVVHSSMFTLERPAAWADEAEALGRSIDAASALGAGLVYGTTGPAGQLTWEQAVEALGRALAAPLVHARASGVSLLLETTNPQYADIDCLHSLRDTVACAEAVGTGVCLDIHASWTEPALQRTIERAAPLVGLVQVSDYLPGTRTLDRAVPGEGVIPLERIIGWILASGYEGLFDVELLDSTGGSDRERALGRAVENLTAMLAGLGA